eukprot:8839922-Alexandrium_andersonii.AAC.1
MFSLISASFIHGEARELTPTPITAFAKRPSSDSKWGLGPAKRLGHAVRMPSTSCLLSGAAKCSASKSKKPLQKERIFFSPSPVLG